MRLIDIGKTKRVWLNGFAVALTCFLVSGGQPAIAEGFPGKGDRLLYAEALPHYNLGNKYLAKEWYEKAVEKYIDAINIYEYDADVYTNLAVAYRKLNDVEGAEKASRKAVELNDTDWTGWSNLANLLMAQDKFPEAYKCFQRVLKCDGVPDQEKTFIESNIDGMKKIMKNRGLTLEGKPIAPPAVSAKPAAKKIAAKAPVKTAAKTQGAKAVHKPAQPAQLAGGKDSELDQNAFNEWLGQ